MISLVMMIVLRNWRGPLTLSNSINVPAGIISMLPNVFPVVVVFGGMGMLGMPVDIGSMMTASVAMGIAVDDTIHFLNWYRDALRQGLDRATAIRETYRRVAKAMLQTTLIAGLGLSAFAFSTFTPTQRFGVMMLVLLAVALIGDLVFLPALLAGPLGRAFGSPAKLGDDREGSAGADSRDLLLENPVDNSHSQVQSGNFAVAGVQVAKFPGDSASHAPPSAHFTAARPNHHR
jgi:uncharacterized membrane protein YdfJ with MMPL/SSD domain